jgi:class 3 adenylate cyclase
VYRRLAEHFRDLGEPLLVYDVACEGLERWPGDVRLRQLKALALADSGEPDTAVAIVEELEREGSADQETLGIMARAYKDLWLMARQPVERAAHLRRAAQAYERAYQQTGGYWTGINAAMMAVMLGERRRAAILARAVHRQCLNELGGLQAGSHETYWPLATLGEAALILGQRRAAERWYAEAANVVGRRYRNLVSTRRNARLLLEQLGGHPEGIERALRVPRVAMFAGHMIDRPDRATPRFPPRLEHAVYDAVRDRLSNLNCRIGYASAACGSDILFHEAVRDLGGQTHVVLPYHHEDYVKHSVEIVPGASWGARFNDVLEYASEVITASDQRLVGDAVVYDYTAQLLHGLAAGHAEYLETELVPLAVWDGKSGDGPAGTADIVQRWQRLGLQVEIVDIGALLRAESPGLRIDSEQTLAHAPPTEPPPPAPFRKEVVALLFADAQGFSRLSEEAVPLFVEHFLGAVQELVARTPHRPVVNNTWGDGLYFVFSSVRDAGLFALDLCELVIDTDWTAKGLADDLHLRTGLHAGPAYRCNDPVTGRTNYFGVHVSRAARIEPITPPDHVYASEAFAALATAAAVSEFRCDYVGQTPLAKGYGTFRTYHVRRT